MNDKTLIVYASPACIPEKFPQQSLIGEIKPLLGYLNSNKPIGSPGNYQVCSALREFHSNTFYTTQPFSTSIKFDKDGQVSSPHLNWFDHRPKSFENSYSFNFDMGWVFFAEDPVKMYVTPPFMHKTTSSNDGFLASGAFDISKWFRPVNYTYNLFPGHNEMSLTEGDASAYYTFITDKKVIIKNFAMNQELFNTMTTCSSISSLHPFRKLSERYTKFKNGNLDKYVLKNIKQNLID
jgi:hypothetical protein